MFKGRKRRDKGKGIGVEEDGGRGLEGRGVYGEGKGGKEVSLEEQEEGTGKRGIQVCLGGRRSG